ncbi:uncharacterized protein B0P05DRAFT_245769 [Gilbertella persicaria]|uniref:uncharacterized protein n=1 Tax=Gilbertella persicaria TaxID=101096 RepID=UPI00221E3AF3|nr:uncharacterized protein B0P05DRAFT_245769 [Gilbertella persicaria]KAI8062324.1 hypothetical protein B0P05DRAFT_245769 [Gilbertella persicaria]
MSSSFWGICLSPGESYPVRVSGILQINQASLPNNAREGKTVLKVLLNGNTFVLCTLAKDKVEHQKLSHIFIREDRATLQVDGTNSLDLMGYVELVERDDTEEEDDDDDEEADTVTGQPTYMNYLSDLLGPDLDDEDDDDYEEDMDMSQDDYGTLAFRDPSDNAFLGGFELRHFNLMPNLPGFEKEDLREQEQDVEESLLNDNIARGLVNALLNSGDQEQIKKGKELAKKLKKQLQKRKRKQTL